mgnify:CR=1 FL=1
MPSLASAIDKYNKINQNPSKYSMLDDIEAFAAIHQIIREKTPKARTHISTKPIK